MANTTKNTKAAPKTAQRSTAKKPSNKPCCKATEVAQENCTLTDFDIASDVLGSQKALIKLYSTALCEIDCKGLRSIVSTKMNEAAEDQLDVFLYMNERGMYKTEPAPLQKVKEARQKYSPSAKKMKK